MEYYAISDLYIYIYIYGGALDKPSNLDDIYFAEITEYEMQIFVSNEFKDNVFVTQQSFINWPARQEKNTNEGKYVAMYLPKLYVTGMI